LAFGAVVARSVIEIGLSKYQVGRLSVGESLSVVPRQHAILGEFVASAVGDVNVIWRRRRIDRYLPRQIESLAVDQVVSGHVEYRLTEHGGR
jgi:hypothetical protein